METQWCVWMTNSQDREYVGVDQRIFENNSIPAAFINNAWVSRASGLGPCHLRINPRTEEAESKIEFASPQMADDAVRAARDAFPSFSQTSVDYRLSLLKNIRDAYAARLEDIGRAISREMGAPLSFAIREQAGAGYAHLDATINALEHFEFEASIKSTRVFREPIGVCALITPWNWPMNQVACKVAPAIAAGCTMVLKPSEYAPLSARIFAEIVANANTPPGVFNIVFGSGPEVGEHIARHPNVDMISFTGSTRGGVAVAKTAADTVKRVVQELGGKSPNILLPDLDQEQFLSSVKLGVKACFVNSGQSCDAPSLMLIPRNRIEVAEKAAHLAVLELVVGAGRDDDLGPLVNAAQFRRVQELIELAISENATLVTGGPGRPDGMDKGYYVRPTVFSRVTTEMTLAREEVFGPVIALMAYDTVEDAISIANDTEYGLSAYVSGNDYELLNTVAKQLRAGMIHVNNAALDFSAPFGGYKRSGNGREWGMHGILEYLETKAVMGFES